MSVIIVTPPNEDGINEDPLPPPRKVSRTYRNRFRYSHSLCSESLEENDEETEEAEALLNKSPSFESKDSINITGPSIRFSTTAINSNRRRRAVPELRRSCSTANAPSYSTSRSGHIAAAYARRACFRERMLSPLAYPHYNTSIDSASSDTPVIINRPHNQEDKDNSRAVRFSYSAENLHTQGQASASVQRGEGPLRNSAASRRRQLLQSHGHSIDIADICAGHMRISGALQPFKGLLGPIDKSERTPRFRGAPQNQHHLSTRSVTPGVNCAPAPALWNISNAAVAENNGQAVHSRHDDSGPSLISAAPGEVKENHYAQTRVDLEPLGGTTLNLGKKSIWPVGLQRTVSRHKLNVSYRLSRRRELFDKRRKASDYALIFACLGIFLMVMENEFNGSKIYNKVGLII